MSADQYCEHGMLPGNCTIKTCTHNPNCAPVAALRNLLPFVLEDYFPDCATVEYKAAVEAAKALV